MAEQNIGIVTHYFGKIGLPTSPSVSSPSFGH